jgi:hypothetical protein
MSNAACLNCGSSELERPLVTLRFQGQELYVYPQCLPTLIHKPHQLADKLPGVKLPENSPEDGE